MNKLVIGMLAHVDAGKTTLSEAMLYESKTIRKLGRVDNQDAFLDTYQLEKERGITIFSKQAVCEIGDLGIDLLDTPGHIDFSAEMERTLQVLDYAILIISGPDGVQGHTETVWDLLKKYKIPVFLFINKMDQPGTEKESIMKHLREKLSSECIDFSSVNSKEFMEEAAMCEEKILEQYLEKDSICDALLQDAIAKRRMFPCFFGSARKLSGVSEFLEGIKKYTKTPQYGQKFGARVFKILRDEQGSRLTYLKITGGSLKVKEMVSGETKKEAWEEKVNQIRIYSGNKFETVTEVPAGWICAVTGLTKTYPGQGLGIENGSIMPFLEPVLLYEILLPEGTDAAAMLPKLKLLEEEIPELHIVWNESLQEIQAQMMGEVQIEIIKEIILQRFGVEVSFGTGNIVYKETIENTVEGVGHFEPLRHYAEVHLLMEPGERGSGVWFGTSCSEDELDKNWQRLIYTHLLEREHKGVLTGSSITDMKITLVSGRAHAKHTEGGDFRQATYRAIRQGLMEAKSVLLEPYYEFKLEVPKENIGRAMADMDRNKANFGVPEEKGEFALLTGNVPVSTMQNYQKEMISYTKGRGKLQCSLCGYEKCHNEEEVIRQIGYDWERDLEFPTGSVFCSHGAGFIVPWNKVKEYMHLPAYLEEKKEEDHLTEQSWSGKPKREESIGLDEIEAILNKVSRANSRDKSIPRKGRPTGRRIYNDSMPSAGTSVKTESKEQYLLVDGYNIIYAWEELKELAEVNIDSARDRLQDILCNYQGIKKCELIVVFDAYKVKGHDTTYMDYNNIHVVFTKEAETADQYIEKFAHENHRKYSVTVATSDGLEQIIIRGQGCHLLSARELKEEVAYAAKEMMEQYETTKETQKNYLFDHMSDKEKEIFKMMD